MTVDLERPARSSDRLEIGDIDFGRFRHEPLDDDALRCLRYMHDVEHHTVCYLRDLLVTRAHRDPSVTNFLTIWAYEEHWHGEAIGTVLAMHGEAANERRVAGVRSSLGARDAVRPLVSQLGSAVTTHFTALHMAWGAVNELSTQAGYAQLIRRAGHPVLTELLKRIMRQEGRHIDFYSRQARDRLAASAKARRLTRLALSRLWRPVGAGVMPESEVRFIARYLFGDQQGRAAAARIDRHVGRLPGLEGLTLVSDAALRFGRLGA